MKQAPSSIVDESGMPLFGTYGGVVKSSSLSNVSGTRKFYRRKKWQYQVIVTPEVIVLYAIVDLNYACSAFLSAFDLNTGKTYDKSFLGLPLLSRVHITDEPSTGLEASFITPGTKLLVEGYLKGMGLYVNTEGLELRARVTCNFKHALTVIAPVEEGLVNVTQKIISGSVNGSLTVAGKKYDLSQGLAGTDYTQGYLARRTCWRWAMGMGRLVDGTPFGFNLVEGINEGPLSNENAFWVGDKFYLVERPVFEWNAHDLMDNWRIETMDGKIKLTFSPKFIHKEHKNLLLIKSTFAQPVGLFSGTVELDDRSFTFTNAGGVTETQDSTW